jgi:ComF family protein
MLDVLRKSGRAAFDLIYPPTCQLCQLQFGNEHEAEHFCAHCCRELTHDPFLTCPRCALSVGPGVDVTDGCPTCRGRRFHFERTIRLGRYESHLRDAVLRMKHQEGETLAETLGLLFAKSRMKELSEWKPDVIIPVPLHWWKRFKRGYNQSETLARSLSNVMGVPYQPRWLRRTRSTIEQSQLSATARRENLKGVFQMSRRASVRDLRILLVDDVLTTGATSDSAAACVLKNKGAAVACAIVARREA